MELIGRDPSLTVPIINAKAIFFLIRGINEEIMTREGCAVREWSPASSNGRKKNRWEAGARVPPATLARSGGPACRSAGLEKSSTSSPDAGPDGCWRGGRFPGASGPGSAEVTDAGCHGPLLGGAALVSIFSFPV